MKTLILTAVLALTAISGVIAASDQAAAVTDPCPKHVICAGS